MKNSLPIAAGFVALIALGAWFALRPPEHPDVPAVAAAYPAKAPATAGADSRLPPSAVLSVDPRPNPLRPAKPVPVRATLFNDFLGARQYRAIYDRLKGSAEGDTAEGRLVLWEILRNCANITEGKRYVWRAQQPKRDEFVKGIAPTDPQRDRRIAAYDDFNASKCQGFEGVNITQADLDKVLAAAAAMGDPRARATAIEQELWQARRTQGRDVATIPDENIEALKQIVSSKDPEAIRVAGRILSNSWNDYGLRIGAEQQPVEQRAFMNAWLVLACEYGQPCGPDTPRMLQACAMQGHCDAQTFPDYLYYYGSTPHDSQLLVQYRATLRQAIETGDWSQIIVARGVTWGANRINFVPGPR